MDDINKRLDRFSSIVLRNVSEERDKLIEETEAKYQSLISEKENEYLAEAYETIQRSRNECERLSGEEFLHAEMDSKKKVLLKREEIINSVMDSVKTRLADFAHSDGYGKWLVKKAQAAAQEAGSGEKIIYVSPEDMQYRNKLKSVDGHSKITVESVSDRGFLGGVRVYNADRRISVDYSFKEMLADARQSFLQNSGLVIR